MSTSKRLQRIRELGITCAICKGAFASARDLKADHDHNTGKARGLLCNNCNVGLGMFQDSSQLLRQAAFYLESEYYPVQGIRRDKRIKALLEECAKLTRQLALLQNR